MAVIADAGSENLRGLARENVLEGSAVLTDRFASYSGLSAGGFSHAAIPMRDDPAMAHRFFPWVHITMSNL